MKEREWIENHPEINISGLFRRLIDFIMEEDIQIITKDKAIEIYSNVPKEHIQKNKGL
jgi:hypothetical protein